MSQLVVYQSVPDIQIDLDPELAVEEIIRLYESVVIEEISMSRWGPNGVLINHIPSLITMDENEQFQEFVDNLASESMFQTHAEIAPITDDNVDEFYQECYKQRGMLLGDIYKIVDFYNISFCIEEKQQGVINFPMKGVW